MAQVTRKLRYRKRLAGDDSPDDRCQKDDERDGLNPLQSPPTIPTPKSDSNSVVWRPKPDEGGSAEASPYSEIQTSRLPTVAHHALAAMQHRLPLLGLLSRLGKMTLRRRNG